VILAHTETGVFAIDPAAAPGIWERGEGTNERTHTPVDTRAAASAAEPTVIEHDWAVVTEGPARRSAREGR